MDPQQQQQLAAMAATALLMPADAEACVFLFS
jgi:hypothetical protein